MRDILIRLVGMLRGGASTRRIHRR